MYPFVKSFSVIVLMLTSFTLYAQTAGFKIGGIYAQVDRPNQQAYITALSTTLGFTEQLDVTTGLGLGLGVVIKAGKGEMEIGGSVTAYGDKLSDDAGNELLFRSSDIAMFYGGNFIAYKYFLLGLGLHINMASNTCDAQGPVAGFTDLESLPSVDFNIFRGFSVGLKGQAGLNIPFNESNMNGMRILPFYALGFGSYNFYSVTEKRLPNYDGSEKTTFKNFGIEVDIILGI